MGLFDRIDKGFKSIGKSIKKETKKAEKKLNKAGFNKNFGRDFQKGFAMTGRALQEPEKFIARNDPIGKKMGGASFLSPIQLATGIITAPISSVGYFEELAGDPKLQKKLRQGDMDTVINTSLAPLGLIPLNLSSSAEKSVAKGVAEGGLKSTTKQVGKKLGTSAIKKTGKAGLKQTIKGVAYDAVVPRKAVRVAASSALSGVKSGAKGITKGAFNPATMKGFKPIKEIPKQPFVKKTLSKAARLKQAKAALKQSGKLGVSIKQLF
jgi:hypothetical protein